MSKKKIDIEEVPEEALHSKVDVDDHIYVGKPTNIFGNPILIFLASALLFAALFSTFYGLLSVDSDKDGRDIGVIKSEYRLTVIHYDESYGGTIDKFNEHMSFNDAFSYRFTVDNKNSVDLDYAVAVIKDSKSTVDMSDLNYRLLKNDMTVQSGKFKNKKTNKIYDAKALSGTTDQYEIKIWSDKKIDGKSLTFKIEILV